MNVLKNVLLLSLTIKILHNQHERGARLREYAKHSEPDSCTVYIRNLLLFIPIYDLLGAKLSFLRFAINIDNFCYKAFSFQPMVRAPETSSLAVVASRSSSCPT